MLSANGSACTLHPCRALRLCGANSSWMTPGQIARTLTPLSWILFIGDSDTRGLALSLLQTLAVAGHGVRVAKADRRLWLGDSDLTNPQASRICHLDFVYTASGVVRSARALNCLEPNRLIPKLPKTSRNQTYLMFGSDYTLREDASAAPRASRASATSSAAGLSAARAPSASPTASGLRVTFVSTTTVSSTVDALRVIGQQMGATRRQLGLLYINTGAWAIGHRYLKSGMQKDPPVAAVAEALVAFAKAHVLPGEGRLVWGSGLAGIGRRTIDDALVPLLPSPWLVLNRSLMLHDGLVGRSAERAIQLTSGHVPHLINHVAIQQLATLVQSARHTTIGHEEAIGRWGPPQPQEPPTRPRQLLTFSPLCAGHVAQTVFLAAYQQLCTVDVS